MLNRIGLLKEDVPLKSIDNNERGKNAMAMCT